MNRNIHFLGELSTLVPNTVTCSCNTIGDVFKLIDCQVQGFQKFLIDSFEAGLDIAVVSKNNAIEEPEELLYNNLMGGDVYVTLVPAGSKKGWAKILAGIILIVVGFFITPFAPNLGPALMSAGFGLALQGVAQLLAKVPENGPQSENTGVFDGPTNTLKQNQPVPVLYGELLIGGAPVYVDLSAGNLQNNLPSVPGSTEGNTLARQTDDAMYTASGSMLPGGGGVSYIMSTVQYRNNVPLLDFLKEQSIGTLVSEE